MIIIDMVLSGGGSGLGGWGGGLCNVWHKRGGLDKVPHPIEQLKDEGKLGATAARKASAGRAGYHELQQKANCSK